MNEFFSIKDVMAILKVSRMTVYNWMGSGKLKFHKVGGLIRIKREDLERFIEGKPKIKTSRKKGRKKSK